MWLEKSPKSLRKPGEFGRIWFLDSPDGERYKTCPVIEPCRFKTLLTEDPAISIHARPHRLGVRTPDSHSGNPGSIPGGAEVEFCWIWFNELLTRVGPVNFLLTISSSCTPVCSDDAPGGRKTTFKESRDDLNIYADIRVTAKDKCFQRCLNRNEFPYFGWSRTDPLNSPMRMFPGDEPRGPERGNDG